MPDSGSSGLPLWPALPSKTQGPASFLGVMGASRAFVGGDGVCWSLILARPEPDAGWMIGSGSDVACGRFPRPPGLSGTLKLTVTSMASVSCTIGVSWSVGALAGAGASGAPFTEVLSPFSPSASSCSQSSEGSSTSASRSAPARQLGQMNMGYCGDVRRDLTHLKCHVCEQGATNSD